MTLHSGHGKQRRDAIAVLHLLTFGHCGEHRSGHRHFPIIVTVGVFTLNTKRHARKKIWVGDQRVLVAGQKVDHLGNARAGAVRASKLISRALGRTVRVSAALVFGAGQLMLDHDSSKGYGVGAAEARRRQSVPRVALTTPNARGRGFDVLTIVRIEELFPSLRVGGIAGLPTSDRNGVPRF